MKKLKQIWQNFIILKILVAIALFIGVNLLFSKYFFRWDLTSEKLYTLSSGSKAIIQEIEEETKLKFYFSNENKEVPQFYRIYAQKVRELLTEYVEYNPDNFSLEVVDPKPDSDEEQEARNDRLLGADLNGSSYKFYFGLTVTRGDKKEVIPFFDIRKESSLEYEITQKIHKISDAKKFKVGIMSEFQVEGSPYQGNATWAFYSELSQFYEVQSFRPTHEIPEDIDILVVFHPKNLIPTPFSDAVSVEIEYAIDQFLLREGKLMLVVDPFMRSDEPSQAGGGYFISSSGATRLFENWGIQYDATSVIADANRNHIVRTNSQKIPYFLWLDLNKDSFDQNVPVVQNLENVLFPEAGGFLVQEKSGLEFQPLMTTSNKTGIYQSDRILGTNPQLINKAIQFEEKQYFLGGLLKGTFSSAFEKAPTVEEIEFKNEHLTEGEGQVLIVSDADWMHDRYSVRKFQLLVQNLVQPLNDNIGLFLNLVEYLGGADKLFAIRSRGNFNRPFEKILQLEREAQGRYREVETSLQKELDDIRKQLSQLQPQEGSNKIVLNQEQLKQIENFQNQEKETAVRLREIRKLLRQDIESLKTRLKTLNITIIPFLVCLIGFFVFAKRYNMKK